RPQDRARGVLEGGMRRPTARSVRVLAFAPIALERARPTGRRSMKALMSALWLVSSLAAGTALAQPAPPNEAGVTMGHWHLNSRDVEANKKIFVAMGGTAVKNGNFDIVKFPGVVVFLNQGPGTPPAVGGTVGTVVNHVG